MSNHPVPPPPYAPAQKNYHAVDSREPLLPGPSSGGGIYDQPDEGDLPDDFKVNSTVGSLELYILTPP